jgi:hypothetical protein
VGQRASRSGASDGYRLWPRGKGDLEQLPGPPTATPRPGASPPPSTQPRRVRIRDAKVGATVTVVGVVTSRAGVIDSEGRRVTVADRSGAILVRYPADSTPPRVGRIIRATGEVSSWFGGLQLEAEARPRVRGQGRVVPSRLRRSPAAADIWQLVRAKVRILEIERDGDTWRAVARLGSGDSLPVVGLAGSAIDPEMLQPGRSARITGIVKPAHPSAADQRPSLAPRSGKDVRLGRLVHPGDDGSAGEDDDDQDDDRDDEDAGAASSSPGSPLTTTLARLEDLRGRVVRVGGRVHAVDGERLTVDDGTARASLQLRGLATHLLPDLRTGLVLNAVGRVRARRGGEMEIVVRDAADIRRAADPVAATPSPSREEPEREVLQPVFGRAAIPTVGPASGSFSDATFDRTATPALADPGAGGGPPAVPLALAGAAVLALLGVAATGLWVHRRGRTARLAAGATDPTVVVPRSAAAVPGAPWARASEAPATTPPPDQGARDRLAQLPRGDYRSAQPSQGSR